MNLTTEFEPIRQWAKDKGILTKGDVKTQTIKLVEELGEYSDALLRNKPEDMRDAIGDMVVVLTSLAFHSGFTIEECINSAYQEIKDRKGKMENNNFIKE